MNEDRAAAAVLCGKQPCFSVFQKNLKKLKKVLAFLQNPCYTRQVPNEWLRGQAVKTLASHAGIRGSIPLGVTDEDLQNVL